MAQNPYQVRLNGVAVTDVKVRNKMVDGEPIGDLELVVVDETLGEFSVEDGTWDADLPQFVLEIRDTTVPPVERRNLPNKGWERVSAKQYLSRLMTMGVIQ